MVLKIARVASGLGDGRCRGCWSEMAARRNRIDMNGLFVSPAHTDLLSHQPLIMCVESALVRELLLNNPFISITCNLI